MASTATAVSQLLCFSSTSRKLPLRRRLSLLPLGTPRSKFSVVMSLGGTERNASTSDAESAFSYSDGASRSYLGGTNKSYHSTEDDVAEDVAMKGSEQEAEIAPQRRAAKIHDFCLGIPFGGLIFGGGLFGFVFSRNPTALRTNVPIGAALLALSTLSLKIWRSGKSSLPFILGQIVLSAALFWKQFRTYKLTKKAFPALFYVLISIAMLCFYSYVILAGGNPPPKKLKPSAYSPS